MGARRSWDCSSGYRLVDLDALLDGLGESFALDSFRVGYEADLVNRIQQDEPRRDAMWTEGLAVGSQAFVERMQGTIKNRMRTTIDEASGPEATWCLREAGEDYA